MAETDKPSIRVRLNEQSVNVDPIVLAEAFAPGCLIERIEFVVTEQESEGTGQLVIYVYHPNYDQNSDDIEMISGVYLNFVAASKQAE